LLRSGRRSANFEEEVLDEWNARFIGEDEEFIPSLDWAGRHRPGFWRLADEVMLCWPAR
jgi:hypothetical protein